MLVFATADSATRDLALCLLRGRVLGPLSIWIGGPEAEARAAEVMAIATGFFLFRLLLPLPSLQGELAPGSRARLAAAFQAAIS